VAAFPDLLRRDRERRGFTVGQVAWRLGVKPQEYRELEAGERFPRLQYVGPDLQAVRVAADVRQRHSWAEVNGWMAQKGEVMTTRKKCPWCAEEIQAEARVCRYCGRDQRPPETPAPVLDDLLLSHRGDDFAIGRDERSDPHAYALRT
jgi:hypothetical protein